MTTASISENNHQNTKIHSTVWKIGWMMFLINLSFVMGYSYIAIYMDSLGVAMAWIGVAEGIAEASSYIMKSNAIKPITFVFRDEKGRVQTITIRRGEIDCTCRPWSTDAAPCGHRKTVETYLAVNLIKVA